MSACVYRGQITSGVVTDDLSLRIIRVPALLGHVFGQHWKSLLSLRKTELQIHQIEFSALT